MFGRMLVNGLVLLLVRLLAPARVPVLTVLVRALVRFRVLVLVLLLIFEFRVFSCTYAFFVVVLLYCCDCTVLDRMKLESTAPHFVQPHFTLAYPTVDVRRDLQQLLTHAVKCSTNSPSDKAKMLR